MSRRSARHGPSGPDGTPTWLARKVPPRSTVDAGAPDPRAAALHRSLPDYAPSPLVDMPDLAALCGLGRLWVKVESSRFGVPSFKMLGASWACYRALAERVGVALDATFDLDELGARLAGGFALTAATDGNHGQAVAHTARRLGLRSRIYVPEGTTEARIAAIEGEGAEVVVVDGGYDDAVAVAARQEDERTLVISDTAWDGYDVVPRTVIDGYATMFDELGQQLPDEPIDLLPVQVGVGALATAAVRWRDQAPHPNVPRMLAVEPTDAACLLRSLHAGEPTPAPPPHRSGMAGLNCGNVSPIAWPVLRAAVEGALTVDDEHAATAVAALKSAGVATAMTGAAGVAGLIRLADPDLAPLRDHLGVTGAARVLAIVTEGRTGV